MKKSNHDGFSLVEVVIAIAITSVVMVCIISLLSYATHSMQQTQAKVALQDQAQDVTKHISSYAMEATDVTWDDTNCVLKVQKDKKDSAGVVVSTSRYLYWFMNQSIYFADASSVDESALTADKSCLLADHVADFQCAVNSNVDTAKKTLHVVVRIQDDTSEFACSNDIYMRNQ